MNEAGGIIVERAGTAADEIGKTPHSATQTAGSAMTKALVAPFVAQRLVNYYQEMHAESDGGTFSDCVTPPAEINSNLHVLRLTPVRSGD